MSSYILSNIAFHLGLEDTKASDFKDVEIPTNYHSASLPCFFSLSFWTYGMTVSSYLSWSHGEKNILRGG